VRVSERKLKSVSASLKMRKSTGEISRDACAEGKTPKFEDKSKKVITAKKWKQKLFSFERCVEKSRNKFKKKFQRVRKVNNHKEFWRVTSGLQI